MGAIGSGRRPGFSTHRTTETVFRIDVRIWCREGRLQRETPFGWRWPLHGRVARRIAVYPGVSALLIFENAPDPVLSTYRVELAHTRCHLGGKRTWFICPRAECRKRVAILYGAEIFACRHCCRLTYESQRETPAERTCRRAENLRIRLNWSGGILDGVGMRPRGMHLKTFQQFEARYVAAVEEWVAETKARFGADPWIQKLIGQVT